MSKYSNLSKEELLDIVEKQDKDLASNKYGLFWDSEREPEQVVLDCANNLPILKRVKGKEIKTDDSEDNILIEGDNYHALTVLNYTHKGKIDVIYIDPPYNTGNKSWKYNNNFVEKDDSYWHSKWLNMMEKRLNIAKNLLTKNGCLICAIDENEFANLYLLFKKVFESYKIDQVVIVHNPRGVQGKNFSYSHEYALFVYPNNGKEYIGNIKREIFLTEELRDHGGNSLRINAKNCFYPFIVKNSKIINIGKVPSDSYHPRNKNIKKKNGIIEIWPIDTNGIERKWIFARQTVDKIIDDLLVRVKEKEKLVDIFRIKREQKPKTVWISQKYDASTHGSKVVKQIIGEDFPYPKSLYTVKDSISVISNILKNKNSIILDFFAGSGTTGHAVLDLNKEDGGNRKFILCTNNELNGYEKELKAKGMSDKEIQEYGICRRVTYPRIEKVIKGYKKNGKGEKVEGLGSNLQYFRTALIKETNDKTQVKIDLTQKCSEMLCVKENIFNLGIKKEDFKIFSSNKKDKFLCVYFNFLENSFDDFLKEIKKIKSKKIIYIFSLENKVRKSLFADIKNKEIKPIPQEILDIYEELVRKNISIKKEIIFLELKKARKKVFEEKEKDDGAKNLRIALEKILQKIAQQNGINFLGQNGKEEKISITNDKLKSKKIISQVIWEENKTYLAIGNYASHGDYNEYNIEQVENFYKYTQSLINKFNF